jgi:hypothetical protein
VLRGTEPVHPIYVRLCSLLEELGDDVTLENGSAFAGGTRFATLDAPVPTRLDVGVVLPGAEPTERLRPADGSGATHVVSLAHEDEIDAELTGWLRDAYGAAR